MKCRYCHKPIIADIQAQTAVEMPEGHAIVHETPCSLLLKREIERNGILKVLAKLSAAIIVIVLLAFTAQSEEIDDQKDWVKGGVAIGINAEGNCLFKPFIKVGITEDNPDDDEAQILGYEPGNVQISRKGTAIWERVKKDHFAPLGRFATFRGRKCRCPPYNM